MSTLWKNPPYFMANFCSSSVKNTLDVFGFSRETVMPCSRQVRIKSIVLSVSLFAIFKSSKGLKSHIDRIHEKEKIFPCTQCQRSFTCKEYLNTHAKRHSQVSNVYGCSQCGKMLSAKSDLVRHYKIHSGKRDHSCTHCKKTFVTNGPHFSFTTLMNIGGGMIRVSP